VVTFGKVPQIRKVYGKCTGLFWLVQKLTS